MARRRITRKARCHKAKQKGSGTQADREDGGTLLREERHIFQMRKTEG
jgi:hypothetical protein